MDFSLIEKLAIIKSLDELILANEVVDPGEIEYLNKIMLKFDFKQEFVSEARKLYSSDCIEILGRMDKEKKLQFSEMLHEMAVADGYADEMEINLIISLFECMGLNQDKAVEIKDYPNMNYLLFKSEKQYNYSDGYSGERILKEKIATVKIEAEVYEPDLFKVSVFEESQTPKLWGLDVIFPTHLMRFKQDINEVIELDSEKGTSKIQIYHDGPIVSRVRVSDISKNIFKEYTK